MNRKVRVRFAPSPTGPLHIGGVRTALYTYLFAKKHGGDMLLRIEDTDSARFVPGAEEYIVESLNWLGITIDEGIGAKTIGKHAPYRQSERKAIYRKYVDQLLKAGLAYIAFDTPAELDAKRVEIANFQYDASTRELMTNSITLSKDEVKSRIAKGEQYVVRIKIEPNEDVKVQDLIRGEVIINSSIIDDKVLFKSSDELPTYHMANVVDDYLMEISHVIRGEEWLPSAPLHIMLYEAFGWEAPQFAHLPLLLRPDGNGKLSKRDGDRLGFPVFPTNWTTAEGELYSGYREKGYFNCAFINMLAFLGWNPGTTQEIFSLEELSEAFTLERVSKAGAKFDPDKTKWFQQNYLRNTSNDELASLLNEQHANKFDINQLSVVCGLMKERATFLEDILLEGAYLLERPLNYDAETIAKKWKVETPEILTAWKDRLSEIENFTTETIESEFKNFLAERNLGIGNVLPNFRLL